MVRFKSLAAAFILGIGSLSAVHAEDTPGTARPAAVQHLITNSAAEWNLDVQLNHADGIYCIGDRMTIEVHSPRECYVHIVNVNPKGEVNVLWPMDSRTSNRVSSGQKVIFPDRGSHPDFVFEATAPVGKELIVCFATQTPLNLKSPDDARMFGEFLNEVSGISPNPLTRLRSFVTKVEPEKSGWTATAFELVTNEKTTPSSINSDSLSSEVGKPAPAPSSVHSNSSSSVAEVRPENAEVQGPPPAEAQNHAGLFTPATGNVSVQFPGEYRTESSTVEIVETVSVRTTITTHSSVDGMLLFSESVIETSVDHFDEHAALNSLTAAWKEIFQAPHDQIKPIKVGRLEGREYRGLEKDGIVKCLRVFVDPVSRSSYIVGSCGSESFVEGPEAVAFLSSLQVIH